MAAVSQLKALQLREALGALEMKINEYTVIDAELSSLPAGKAVYTRQASGLVLYRTDPAKARSEHRLKLEESKTEHSKLRQELQKLPSTSAAKPS